MSMIVRIELGVLELTLSDHPGAAEIDLAVEAALGDARRNAFVAACTQAEKALLAGRACPECGGRLAARDVDRRQVVMLAGAVSVPVRRLACDTCGHRTSPLADLLPQTRHTAPAIERALLLATEVGYAKSSYLLRRLSGIQISHEQIRRPTIAESARVADPLEEETEDLFERGVCPKGCAERTGKDTVVIAMDGGLVADRATGENFEVRVGVVWCGTAGISKGRRALMERRGYAGLEGTTEFAQHELVKTRGPKHAQTQTATL